MSEESGDKSQKTEQPTTHRLEKAREKGQIAVSREFSHWVMLVTIACLLCWVLPSSFKKLNFYLAIILENADYFPKNALEVNNFTLSIGGQLLKFFAIPFAGLFIAALAGYGVQTGFNISSESMKPSFSKLSISKGIGRLFGKKGLAEFVKSLLKLILIAGLAYMVFWPERLRISHFAELSPPGFLKILNQISNKFMIWVLSILAIIAILDYFYQRFMWLQDLRMSHQEIKEEHKEQEGDPHIKGRIRQLRQERARRRVTAEIPKATVLITNPTHFAIALKYEFGTMEAPIVTAKGADLLALKMREIAKEHDVPIVENPPLARALFKEVKEGKEIPYAHFEAVAKIMQYIMSRKRS